MKQDELMQCTTCNKCRRKIGHTGLPLFYLVTIERFGIDMNAVKRQDGLSMLIGNARIAAAMGPDEEMAKSVMDPVKLTICEACSMESVCIAALAEIETNDRRLRE